MPPIPPGKVRSLNKYLAGIESEAPFIVLLPGQGQALGGSLFPECDQVVRSVAAGMIDEPELFADIEEDGRDLMNGYLAGVDLDVFIARQETLLSAAKDTRVALKAQNLQRALGVLGQVRRDEDVTRERIARTQKDPSPEEKLLLWRRRVVLLEAYGLVSAYYASLQTKKIHKKAARHAANAAPAAHKPPVSAKQEKARQQTKDGCWLEALEVFEDKVRSASPQKAAAGAPSADLGPSTSPVDPGPSAPPSAYSPAGLRRMAVLEGDRRAVDPARRRPPSTPFQRAIDPTLDRYLSASHPRQDDEKPAARARHEE